MRFGGEVNDAVTGLHGAIDHIAVPNVAVNKLVTRIVLKFAAGSRGFPRRSAHRG